MDVSNTVLRSEWVGDKVRALGVVAPFAIHDVPVIMGTAFKPDRGPPYAMRGFSEVERLFQPLSEIADQLDGGRTGRSIAEHLNFGPRNSAMRIFTWNMS